MSKELVHQFTSEALRDYSQLDTHDTGHLNLVDIAQYEKRGPEQARVGKFLEDNWSKLSGISEANPKKGDHDVTLRDLAFTNLYSSTNYKEQAQQTNQDAMVSGAISGAVNALEAPVLPIINAANSIAPFAGFGAGAVIEGAVASAGYNRGSEEMRKSIDERNKRAIELSTQ